MVTAAPQVAALDAALLGFGSRLDDARQQLYFVDTTVLRTDARLVSKGIRAGIYVQIAAAVEVFVSDATQELISEITAASIPARELRLSLFAISSGGHFSSLGDVRGLKNWDRRCEVLESIGSEEPIVIDGSHVPLDGRTIRPEHFTSLWRVFGLPGQPLPSPLHSLALNDLADSRNDVAHGNETLVRVAGRKSPSDMTKFINRVEEVALHLYGAVLQYLAGSMYRR